MENPFQVAEAVYYSAVFVVGFLSGISQTLRDRDFVSGRHAINIGMVSGFLAFAVVTFVDGHIDDRAGDEFFYLGVAALIGLSVKHQDQVIRAAWKGFADKFGLNPDEEACKVIEEDDSSE